MSRSGIIALISITLVLGVINVWAVNLFGRDVELYPMTAWQMFSGRAKKVVRRFEFELIPEPGAQPVVVDGTQMFIPGESISEAVVRRNMVGLWKSCDYGCPDYRLKNFRYCRRVSVDPWIIPQPIGDAWIACGQTILEMDRPPFEIRFIKVEYELGEDLEANLETMTREVILAWRPRSGGYEVEPDPVELADPSSADDSPTAADEGTEDSDGMAGPSDDSAAESNGTDRNRSERNANNSSAEVEDA